MGWDAVGVEAALGGPSPEVFQTGHWFLSEDAYLSDDELSGDECNLICGVYKVFTDKQHQTHQWPVLKYGYMLGSGKQDSHQSWWPKPNAWEKCSLNIGQWTDKCETWFQICLEKIQSGNAKLKTGQEWTHSLNMHHDTKKVTSINRKLAGNALHLD